MLYSIVALAALVIVRNTTVRQNLNRIATQAISSRFLQIVDGYFSPLFQFMSTSSLWTRIGDIESIGSPELYVESLYQSLKMMGSVSTLSLLDKDERELYFRIFPDGAYEWYETTPGAEDSLIDARNRREIEYLNLNDVDVYSPVSGEYPVWFRMSRPYILPGSEVPGSTIQANFVTRTSDFALKLSLDLPISRFADFLEPVQRFRDAIIVLVLPGDEFLIISVEEIIGYDSKPAETGYDKLNEIQKFDEDFVVRFLDASVSVDSKQHQGTTFEYLDRKWQADFRNMGTGTQDIRIGTLVPVDALWTTDIFLPVQIAVAAVFGFTALLVLLVIRDFRKNADPLSDADILRKLIGSGESSSLEFKSSLRWDYRQNALNKELEGVIMKSIAAFSNSTGGTLLIGVDDSGVVLGLEPDYSCLKEAGPDYFELHLRSLLIRHYGTDMASRNVRISFTNLDGSDVCRVDVLRGRKPLYTSLPSKGAPPVEKFFVRSGNSSRAIESLGEITSYIVSRFGRRALL